MDVPAGIKTQKGSAEREERRGTVEDMEKERKMGVVRKEEMDCEKKNNARY